MFLWLQDHREQPPPGDWPRLLGGAALEARTPAAWLLNERRPPDLELYLGHAAGRDELHPERARQVYADGRGAYLRSRDREAWPRDFDPFAREAFEHLDAALDRARERFGAGPFRAVSLGDEIGLTPFGDPVSQALSAHESAAWSRWLADGAAERFGLDADAAPIGTGQALRTATDEAFAAFLARRTFERETFSHLILKLAQNAQQRWPGTPIALLGLGGESTWHGLDLSLLARELGVLEPYGEGHALAMCDTLRLLGNGRPELWRTLFASGPDAPSFTAGLKSAVERSADALVLWSDRALASEPDRIELLKATLEHWHDTESHALPRDTALLYDFDSLCRGWFLDALRDGGSWPERLGGYQAANGTTERAQRKWLEDRRARGLTGDVLPLDRLGEPATLRLRTLVAIELRVLDATELEALAAHLDRGGHLSVRGGFARLRPDGSRWPRTLLAEWIRDYPGQVARSAD